MLSGVYSLNPHAFTLECRQLIQEAQRVQFEDLNPWIPNRFVGMDSTFTKFSIRINLIVQEISNLTICKEGFSPKVAAEPIWWRFWESADTTTENYSKEREYLSRIAVEISTIKHELLWHRLMKSILLFAFISPFLWAAIFGLVFNAGEEDRLVFWQNLNDQIMELRNLPTMQKEFILQQDQAEKDSSDEDSLNLFEAKEEKEEEGKDIEEDEKSQEAIHRGILNLGNTCYVNSVIQALLLSEQFLQSFLSFSFQNNTLQILQNLLAQLSMQAPGSVDPKCFLDSIYRSCGLFSKGIQADASEFLKYVLNLIDEEFSVAGKQSCFKGMTLSIKHCLSCNSMFGKEEEFNELNLMFPNDRNLLNGSLELDSMLKSYFSKSVMDGQNQYQCSNCCKLNDAHSQTLLIHHPDILILSLKRFQLYNGSLDKIMTRVDAPEKIRIEDVEYSLYACVIHSGYSMKHGHYYTMGRKSSSRDWFLLNDSQVEPISFEQISNVSKERDQDVPYLYFYSKI
jgi:ubiquitin C-terminal hydrolase